MSMNVEEYKYDEPSRKRTRSRKYGASKRSKRYSKSRRVPRSFMRGTVHKFKQTITGSTMLFGNDTINQTAAAQHLTTYFSLSMAGNSGAISSMFDRYRITKIVFKMLPQGQFVATKDVAAAASNSGAVAALVDTDDSTALTTFDQYLQYDTVKYQQTHCQRPVVLTFRPNTQTIVFDGASSIGSPVSCWKWIDMANVTARYYGVKIYVDPYASAGTAQFWRVFADIYIECKDLR